ncbi:MAG: GNAT family N-acetyltransferase [Gemmataceae bacterium]
MHIRLYQPDDLDTLRDITVEAFQGVSIDENIEKRFGVINGRDWRFRKGRHVDADVAAHAEGIFVLVEPSGTGERILGYISTRLDREAGIGLIPNLVLIPEARGQGLGKRLIEHALDYFRSQGLTHAKIETLDQNAIGQKAYPALGFVEVARQIHYVREL